MKEARYYALNLHSSAVIELGVMKESEAYPTLRKKSLLSVKQSQVLRALSVIIIPSVVKKQKRPKTKADGLKLFNLME